MSNRKKQKGLADVVPLAILLMIVGYLVLFIFSLIVSFVAPFKLLNGRARKIVLVFVIIFWGGVFWVKIISPKIIGQVNLKAYELCSKEIKEIPEKIEIDGFVDEGAGLTFRSIDELFKRGLEFIEIKIPKIYGKEKKSIIAYENGDGIPWETDESPGIYARIALGKEGDPDCVKSEKDLKYEKKIGIKNSPYIPDTCLLLSYHNESKAKYKLMLIDKNSSRKNGDSNAWGLLDLSTGKYLISLPTGEKGDTWTRRGGINRENDSRVNSCQSPHAAVLDRIFGVKNNKYKKKDFIFDEISVSAKVNPKKIESYGSIGVVNVVAEEMLSMYSKLEQDAWSGSGSNEGLWRGIVLESKKTGVATDRQKILDWQNRILWSLTLTPDGDNYPWVIFSSSNGFFVVSDSASSWRGSDNNIVMYYRKDGELDWVVNVISPSYTKDPSCRFSPRAIQDLGERVYIHTGCRLMNIEERSMTDKDAYGLIWDLKIKNRSNWSK